MSDAKLATVWDKVSDALACIGQALDDPDAEFWEKPYQGLDLALDHYLREALEAFPNEALLLLARRDVQEAIRLLESAQVQLTQWEDRQEPQGIGRA